TGEVPVADGDGGLGPDDLDDGAGAARDDDRRGSGEVAALLGGAAAGAAGAGVVGAATSARGGVGGSGAPDDDDRPGAATAEIARPGRAEDARPVGESDDAAGEAADDEPEEDRLTQIWDEPAAHDVPPAPEPAVDRDVDEPEPEVVDEQDVLTGSNAPEP